MTIKDMNDAIQAYCERMGNNHTECVNCVLNKICNSIGGDFESNPEDCIQAFKIVISQKEKESDSVNHPAHYQGKHECIDEMVALFGVEAVKAFCKCNVYKYRFRAANKNGQEDLDKADWYMDKLMELEGEKHD